MMQFGKTIKSMLGADGTEQIVEESIRDGVESGVKVWSVEYKKVENNIEALEFMSGVLRELSLIPDGHVKFEVISDRGVGIPKKIITIKQTIATKE